MTLLEQKRSLRAEQRRRLAAMAPEDRVADSEALCGVLSGLPLWQGARSVLAFAARADEPDLAPLLRRATQEGKTVALPRFIPATGLYEAAVVWDWERDLVGGEFGILEPSPSAAVVPLKQLDLVLVPGLAFDAKGARLGRGKGFYDRLLADVSGHRCGVLFEWQLVGEVPLEPHDRLMNSILTPVQWRLAAS
jgi:5-formyltetrahydrofolate cyclo-ligase